MLWLVFVDRRTFYCILGRVIFYTVRVGAHWHKLDSIYGIY